ncbi:hypothetical protein [Clostridium sp.]|uniref:hypothetical protein n=1 Tax=Clostridium sp. TaxID=1506 RepID=UPI003F398F23
MKTMVKKLICFTVLLVALTVTIFYSSVNAEPLPNKFLIVDDNGISADTSNGEYYVKIDDMLPGEEYTNKIHLSNLSLDSNLNLYMRMEPVESRGDVDLFELVTITLSIDDNELYKGSPNGFGSIDMQSKVKEIGSFKPGEEKVMYVTAMLDSDMNGEYNGDIDFKWVFSAVKNVNVDKPQTGITFDKLIYLIILLFSVSILILYVIKEKRERDCI